MARYASSRVACLLVVVWSCLPIPGRLGTGTLQHRLSGEAFLPLLPSSSKI
jgi:hypothetical protein